MTLYRDCFFDYNYYELVAGHLLPVLLRTPFLQDSHDQFQFRAFALKINHQEHLTLSRRPPDRCVLSHPIGYRRYRRHKCKMHEDGNKSPI
jgi:hypothetical protein